MKRVIAIVLGAGAIALAVPTVAVADTGSASGSAQLLDAYGAILDSCGLLPILTGACNGTTGIHPSPFPVG